MLLIFCISCAVGGEGKKFAEIRVLTFKRIKCSAFIFEELYLFVIAVIFSVGKSRTLN